MDGSTKSEVRNVIEALDIGNADLETALDPGCQASGQTIYSREPRERGHVANQKISVAFLPQELLVEIWNHVSEAERWVDYYHVPFPFVASWVSSSWRSVAINTPCIWCDIHILPGQSVALLKTQLQRSKNCSLTVVASCYSNDFISTVMVNSVRYHRNLLGLMTAASAHIDRWNTFEFSVRRRMSNPAGALLQPLRDAHAPRLKYLRARCHADLYSEPLFAGGAPVLSHAVFHEIDIRSNLVLVNGLTFLELEDIPFPGRPTHREFRNALAACPHLIELSLHGQFSQYDPLDAPAIHVPSLRILRIHCRYWTVDCASHFFTTFLMPALESLTLHGLRPVLLETLVDMMTTSLPSLRYPVLSKLCLSDTDVGPDENSHKLLSCFPLIEELELSDKDPSCSSILESLALYRDGMGSSDYQPRWPRLRTLTWWTCDASDSHVVQNVISRRIAMGCPIVGLRVDPSYYKAIPPASRAWISAHVDVKTV